MKKRARSISSMQQNNRTPKHRSGRCIYLTAFLVFLLLAVFYIFTIVQIDNTNLATTNGLWKSVQVRAWELGTGRPGDSGGFLYLPAYGLACRLIPDQVVSYGVHGTVLTHRKMAILNALLGALSSGVVFLLAFRLLGRFPPALVVALAHASTGFVLLNSLNSEDIICGYLFFILTSFAFLEFVRTQRRILLMISAMTLTLVTLFHWTLLIPCLAAIGIVLSMLAYKKKIPVSSFLIFPISFLAGLAAFALIVNVFYPGSSLSVMKIIYPAKAHPSGWLGFRWDKAAYTLVGVGNYFSGAQNVVNYHSAFRNLLLLKTMGVSWFYLAATLAACLWALFSQSVAYDLKAVAGFGMLVFLFGALENLYGQPQDPQSQIQPMFVTVVGLIILLRFVWGRFSKKIFCTLLLFFAASFALNAIFNVSLMYRQRGYDGISVSAVKRLAELFPPSRTVIVSTGFEGWNTWLYVEVYHGEMKTYLSKNIHLYSAFILNAGISGEEAAGLIRQEIDKAFAQGHRVVAGALWTMQRQDWVQSMTTVADVQKASVFYDALRRAFFTGRSWETPVGHFVELLPK